MPTITITLTQIQVDALELSRGAPATDAAQEMVAEVADGALAQLRSQRRRELEGEIPASHLDLGDQVLITEFKRRRDDT